MYVSKISQQWWKPARPVFEYLNNKVVRLKIHTKNNYYISILRCQHFFKEGYKNGVNVAILLLKANYLPERVIK